MPNENEKIRHVAPMKLKLLITVVPRGKAGFYIDFIQSFDVNMQASVPAHGTASSEVMQYLGLTDPDKTAIFSIVREDRLDALADALEQKFRSIRDGDGVAVAVPLTSMAGTALFGFLSNDRRALKEETANE